MLYWLLFVTFILFRALSNQLAVRSIFVGLFWRWAWLWVMILVVGYNDTSLETDPHQISIGDVTLQCVTRTHTHDIGQTVCISR